MADTGAQTGQVDGAEEFAQDGPGIYARWDAELRLAKKEFDTYRTRCRQIVRRYRSESGDANETDTRPGLQLLWSTVQTQIPAVYQFPPQVEVSRRFKAKSPISRVASLILERYMQVEIDRDRIGDETLGVLLDRLLCAQGQMWVEYEPIIAPVPQPVVVVRDDAGNLMTQGGEAYTGDEPQEGPDGQLMGMQPFDQMVDCRAPAVHIDLEDFLHSPARKWREVRWVARRQFFTRDECVKQFGDGMAKYEWTPGQIPLAQKAKLSDEDENGPQADLFRRAEVWQVWDDEVIYYICQGMGVPLDVVPRPMELKGCRWPCPRPLYGTMTTSSMIPVPDFIQWQDMADEVDELTARIESLTRAVKVVGAYPASAPELDRVLNDTTDNELIAVDNWAAFKERGGIEGMVSMMPIGQVIEALTKLQEQRRERIEYIYQINGIGDILRGQGDPRATATQEKIKASYGSLRLRQMQQDLGQFIERVLEIKAEVICEKAPPEVLAEVSAIGEIESEHQYIQPALQMLKDSRMRDLRIDVDERSMVAMQDEEEKAARGEFLQNFAPMLDRVMAASQQMPALLDVVGETMLFGVRGYRVGRDMEGTFEQFVESVRQQSAQAREQAKANPPPPPLPLMVEQAKAANAAKLEQMQHQNKMQQFAAQASNDAEAEKANAISEAAIEQMREQSKQRTAEMEAQLQERMLAMESAFDMRLERFKAELKAENDRQMAAMKEESLAGVMMRGLMGRRVLKERPDGTAYSEMEFDDDESGGVRQ